MSAHLRKIQEDMFGTKDGGRPKPAATIAGATLLLVLLCLAAAIGKTVYRLAQPSTFVRPVATSATFTAPMKWIHIIEVRQDGVYARPDGTVIPNDQVLRQEIAKTVADATAQNRSASLRIRGDLHSQLDPIRRLWELAEEQGVESIHIAMAKAE